MLTLNEAFLYQFLPKHEIDLMRGEAEAARDLLTKCEGKGNDFLGWLALPEEYDREELKSIKRAAEEIRKSADVLVVLGIGGSYLGARAAIEFLGTEQSGGTEVVFSGNTLSTASIKTIIDTLEGKDVCLNVISKSGTTTETAIAFRIFRDFLYRKYGEEEACRRIYVTTDRSRGTLKHFADEHGCTTFVIPDDVGGRYSVLTAVGLLPIAVAGANIDALLEGAASARRDFLSNEFAANAILRYAAIRNALYRKGKKIEILVSYEPYMLLLNEWWKQLYGESEGKEGKGLYPSSVIFSTDLHSLGQYIQEGERILFETVLDVAAGEALLIPYDEKDEDGLNFLAGKPLSLVNTRAMQGTLLAHNDGAVPSCVLSLKARDEAALGYLFYFFEAACAISGYMLGVNPFDQPGVEAYKRNMFALLGKPGYEEDAKRLAERLEF